MSNTRSRTDRYRAVDVPVPGGLLRVGVWESAADAADGPNHADAPTLLAVHGVTASHRCWLDLVDALPGWRVIAPDLRGRGRSRELPPPFGMARHADDMAAVLDHLGVQTAVVVGHSMGGFVAMAVHHRHRERVASLVLVDGGLPLFLPDGMTVEQGVAITLGPALQRLSMTFPDREAYRDFFRAHPSFVGNWSDEVTDYVDYDLVGEPPELHSATTPEAVARDTDDFMSGGEWLLPALEALPSHTPLLTAPRNLIDAEPGLYPPEWIKHLQQQFPSIDVRDVPDVNHYTIVLSKPGAAAVAEAVNAAG